MRDTGDKDKDLNEVVEKARGSDDKQKRGGLKASVKELEAALKRESAKAQELEKALEESSAEASENYERLLRSRAEYDNLKKRTRRDIEHAHRTAGEKLVTSLLPAIDDLEKAIDAAGRSEELRPMEEGLELIRKRMVEALGAAGVEPVEPLGQPFDPNLQEAVMQVPKADTAPGTVVEVLLKGYLMNGITLRAAKVIVSGTPEGEDAPERETKEGRNDREVH